MRHRLQVALVCAWLIIHASGCSPTGLYAQHEVVLVRTNGAALVRVADDAIVRCMPHRSDVSIETFVSSYVETFPAERAAVLALAEDVLGLPTGK